MLLKPPTCFIKMGKASCDLQCMRKTFEKKINK